MQRGLGLNGRGRWFLLDACFQFDVVVFCGRGRLRFVVRFGLLRLGCRGRSRLDRNRLRRGSRLNRRRSCGRRTRTRRDDKLVRIADDRTRRGLDISAVLRRRDDLVRVTDHGAGSLHGLCRRPNRRRDDVAVLVLVFRMVRLRRRSAEAEELSDGVFEPGRFLFGFFLRNFIFRFIVAVLVNFRHVGSRRSPGLALGRVDAAGTSG